MAYVSSFHTKIKSSERNVFFGPVSLGPRVMLLKPYSGHMLMASPLEEGKDRLFLS